MSAESAELERLVNAYNVHKKLASQHRRSNKKDAGHFVQSKNIQENHPGALEMEECERLAKVIVPLPISF